MHVNTSNDVKIYNLSAGKFLPDWISSKKRRQAEKNDVQLRRRIQIFQDFDMPEISSSIKVSPDGQYVLAAGAYKPRVRCFDTAEMSMKFERCMDAEIVKFLILSEDYSKMVFLHSDRYLEMHAQYGKYYRVRIPKFGRDMAYQPENCHLCVVGASRDVYRLNLEEGKFVESMASTLDAEYNTCDVNPVHQLFVTGLTNGYIETFDPRSGKSEGMLNCALPDIVTDIGDTPFAVSKVKFRDSLNLAVGTSSGHILLYDIRCQRPYFVKDHNYSLPIKSIEFIAEQDCIASMDSKILKIWERSTGKAVTSVEPGTDLNDLCIVPNTGMFFLANEAPKILTYFIPSVGPAPRWCTFLDSLTQELEETAESAIYDDYKFLTTDELESLGLSDLIGTNLLRAYMHGFFVDVRLYKKAKSIVEPFNYEEYRKEKIHQKISSEQNESRVVKKDKLPKVNAMLVERLRAEAAGIEGKKKKSKGDANVLEDERFGALFKNPDFQIDPESDEYKLLNPLVSKMEKRRQRAAAEEDAAEEDAAETVEEIQEGTSRARSPSSESSDDDRSWIAERKKQHRTLRDQKRRERNKNFEVLAGKPTQVREVIPRGKDEISGQTVTLGRRLRENAELNRGVEEMRLGGGNRQMTFTVDAKKKFKQNAAEHLAERRTIHRSVRPIESKLKKPWMRKGKR
ncbi:nucleolar protein 10-like [Paramacrobiotus metropolitanus]|uniref:nucleolar protein 10-like n=1 Tax=Paramacrobiotus metropolitanus TaxID=2943436 RepID=UPI0024461B33|nr:nucleolar protein 10-like [Paramacrobiotus metropolitanus]